MNPILASKAKEIWISIINAYKSNTFFEQWFESKEAAALLSGEDWISVKDRLPPLDEAIEGVETKEVDVKFSDGTEGSAWLNGINGWCAWGMNKNNLPVTHWKLPEPPKP